MKSLIKPDSGGISHVLVVVFHMYKTFCLAEFQIP